MKMKTQKGFNQENNRGRTVPVARKIDKIPKKIVQELSKVLTAPQQIKNDPKRALKLEWSGLRDSNSRPHAPKARALPTAPNPE